MRLGFVWPIPRLALAEGPLLVLESALFMIAQNLLKRILSSIFFGLNAYCWLLFDAETYLNKVRSQIRVGSLVPVL